jgi:hypothetical protein
LEEIFVFSNSGHLGYRTALTDTILKVYYPRPINAMLALNWLTGFRREGF